MADIRYCIVFNFLVKNPPPPTILLFGNEQPMAGQFFNYHNFMEKQVPPTNAAQ